MNRGPGAFTRHAALYAVRIGRLGPALDRAVERVGVTALSVSKKKLTQLIYSKPVPKNKNGKPRWKRTGRLRRGEEVAFHRATRSISLINRVAYAEPRHEAGKPGRRKTQFPAHWRDETVEAMKSLLPDIVQSEVRKALSAK